MCVWKSFLGLVAVMALPPLAAACETIPQGTVPPEVTIGQMASEGARVYANRCARCHGIKGQGIVAVRLIGEDANVSHIEHYADASKLWDFVKIGMPKDKPGSLTDRQRHGVVCFLLVENARVDHEMRFDPSVLASISLGGASRSHN